MIPRSRAASRVAHRLRVAALLIAGLVAPAGSLAGDGEPWVHDQRVGIQSGYAWGFGAIGSQRTSQENIAIVPLLLTWSVATAPLLSASWMKGRAELQIEGQLLFERRPVAGGFGGGAAFDLRYDWLRWHPIIPFVGAGLGILGTDFGVQQSDGLNFVVQAGAGLHWRFGERWALTLQYRAHHVSNANSRTPNYGINTHMVLIGPSWFLD